MKFLLSCIAIIASGLIQSPAHAFLFGIFESNTRAIYMDFVGETDYIIVNYCEEYKLETDAKTKCGFVLHNRVNQANFHYDDIQKEYSDTQWLHPAVSADGKKIVFVNRKSDINQIITMNLDGTDYQIVFEETDFVFAKPSFTFDGYDVVFLSCARSYCFVPPNYTDTANIGDFGYNKISKIQQSMNWDYNAIVNGEHFVITGYAMTSASKAVFFKYSDNEIYMTFHGQYMLPFEKTRQQSLIPMAISPDIFRFNFNEMLKKPARLYDLSKFPTHIGRIPMSFPTLFTINRMGDVAFSKLSSGDKSGFNQINKSPNSYIFKSQKIDDIQLNYVSNLFLSNNGEYLATSYSNDLDIRYYSRKIMIFDLQKKQKVEFNNKYLNTKQYPSIKQFRS